MMINDHRCLIYVLFVLQLKCVSLVRKNFSLFLTLTLFLLVFIFSCLLSFAVVTGATDGIGKSYAKQLAKQGKNIILISRT